MGCGQSAPKFAQLTVEQRNREIEQALVKERNAQSRIVKILLLGGPESGKTTIFKQMRILHLTGFSKTDLINYRFAVHSNCLTAMQQVLHRAKSEKIRSKGDLQKLVVRFEQFCRLNPDELTREMGEIVSSIWQDMGIQKAFELRWQFSLPEYTKHYLDRISEICSTDYVPPEHDVLLCRVRTLGISELDFPHKLLTFKIVDVGGQRSERRKWIHCFDDVQLVIFVAGLADFDKMSDENPEINRLQENIQIFDSVVSNELFQHTTVVLFLNKKDIFEQKLRYTNFAQSYPEYTGMNSRADCCAYIEQQFRKKVNNQQLFVFETVATDTKNIENVFNAAIDHVINKNMRQAGVY